MFSTVSRKPKSESIIDEMLQLKESCSTFHNYLEKMKEFQYYVDTVKYPDFIRICAKSLLVQALRLVQ